MSLHHWRWTGDRACGNHRRAEGVRRMPLAMEFGLLLLAQAAANPDLPALPAPVTLPACPPGRSAGDIVVCGRRNDGGGYRLPAPDRFDPAGPVDSVSRERHRLLDVGASGIGSC